MNVQYYLVSTSSMYANLYIEELAWRSSSVMDCHATAQGLIPCGTGVKTKLQVLCKG